MKTRIYQTGFKEGTSTSGHICRLMTQIHPVQRKKRRKYAALIDLQKAYDTVNREKLSGILSRRCQNETDRTLAMLIVKMYQQS